MSDRELVAALEAALDRRLDEADVAGLLDRATERGLAEAEEVVARLVRRRALRAALEELDAEPVVAAGPPPGDPEPDPAGAHGTAEREPSPDHPSTPPGRRVLLAHAVIEGSIQPAADDVETIAADGLTVVASWADAADLDESRWSDRPDRQLIERMVGRHDDIVREACSAGRAVPLRFGGIFRSPARLRAWLEEHRAELAAGIALVGGCWEWTVRGVRDAETREALADIAVADLPSGDDRLDAAYLVQAADQDRFTAAVETFRAGGGDLELSGPWPPYSFADTTAVPTDRAG